jgi:hypothetical protein
VGAAAGGQTRDLVHLRGRVHAFGDPNLTDRAAMGYQQLENGLAAFDLVAT